VGHKNAQPALAAFEAIAKRMALTLNRDKTRETRVTEGCDFLGVQYVKRKSPTSGKPALSLFPAKSAQRTIRNKLKSLTSRRAPSSPQEFVAKVNPGMTGGATTSGTPTPARRSAGCSAWSTVAFGAT
jgi:RNA-directed DNA polymerase